MLKAYTRSGDRWGVFIDYCSLPQPEGAAHRLQGSDLALLEAGMEGLGRLYSHPCTTVLRLTTLPEDFPGMYDLPEDGANTTIFDRRGWTWAESCLGFLIKPSELCPDIGRWSGAFDFATGVIVEGSRGGVRAPPKTPQQFRIAIASKAFSRPEDASRVMRIYESTFAMRFEEAKILSYAGVGWGDEDVFQLAQVLGYRGGLPRLELLHLDGNRIGDRGACVLAEALPQLRCLRRVTLSSNRIGRIGMDAIIAAKSRCGPSVSINLWDNLVPAAMVLQASNDSLQSMGESVRTAMAGVRSELKEAWNAMTAAYLATEARQDAEFEARLEAGVELLSSAARAEAGNGGGKVKLSLSPPRSPPHSPVATRPGSAARGMSMSGRSHPYLLRGQQYSEGPRRSELIARSVRSSQDSGMAFDEDDQDELRMRSIPATPRPSLEDVAG